MLLPDATGTAAVTCTLRRSALFCMAAKRAQMQHGMRMNHLNSSQSSYESSYELE